MFAGTTPSTSSNCWHIDDVYSSETVKAKQGGKLLVRSRIFRWVPGFYGLYCIQSTA